MSIDEKTAKKLLKRICRAISTAYGTEVAPNYYFDKTVSIVSEDREIAAVKSSSAAVHKMFFADAINFIETILSPNTVLYFSPLGKDKVEIDTSKMFGTTLEEVRMKLDLMNV